MRNLTSVLIAALLACTFVTDAIASPVVFDGNIDSGDSYLARLEDANEDTFGTSSFDIDGVEFDEIAGWLYIGVQTVGAFDRTGGPTAFPPVTQFVFFLDDGSQNHLFTMRIDSSSITLFEGYVPVAGAGWDAEIAGDLEIRLDMAVLLVGFDHNDFFFQARLDNSDIYLDDMIMGNIGVPEPASIILLTTGGLAFLRRRRR